MVNHHEDIHALIPKEVEPEVKVPMYHSKFSSSVRKEVKDRKYCHQTMGYAQIALDPPTNFLKKRTRLVRRPHADKSKPPIPPKESLPQRPKSVTVTKSGEKNFKKENIVRVMRSVPKQPVPAFADTVYGNKQHLIPSGLLPKYIHSKGFGKTPKYIIGRQKAAEKEIEAVRRQEMKKKPPLRYVTEDERQELLEGLKKNWQDLQKEFQLLPMVTDTVPKIKRKALMEKELKELERDIDLVERNPIIYVDDQKQNHRRNMTEE